MDTPKPSIDLKKWVLMIGIAIVFNLFVNYGINTVYDEPDISKFCEGRNYPMYGPAYPEKLPFINVSSPSCPEIKINGTMQRDCIANGGYVDYKYDDSGCATESFCQFCEKNFFDAEKQHNANVFIILVAIGVIVIIAGVLISVESVGGGLLFAGIICIIIAAIRSWGSLHEWVRLIFLGIVLALLIFVGYKKIK